MKKVATWLTAWFFLLLTACDKSSDDKKSGLELVFTDSTYQLTGVAVSSEGRLFSNYPYWSDTYKNALVEIVPVNAVKPYPNQDMNNWKAGDNGDNKWVCVQAVYIDKNNSMWVVDPAAPKMGDVYQNSYKLVKINLGTNAVERTYKFTGAAGIHSYINDVRVDVNTQTAYLTNSSEGGIVVLNLATGGARQVLQDHYSVKSDTAFKFIVEGRELVKNGKPAKINADGIALTPSGDYLYYKPLSDDKLYRIKTEFLRNASLTASDLAAKVEDLGHFTTSDGMIFDKYGNLYLGDIQNSRIIRISPDMRVTTVIQDGNLIWPDSYSISDDGFLYVSCSQIQKQPDYNAGVNKRTTPYSIYRIKIF